MVIKVFLCQPNGLTQVQVAHIRSGALFYIVKFISMLS